MRLTDLLLYIALSFIAWMLIAPTEAEQFLRGLW